MSLYFSFLGETALRILIPAALIALSVLLSAQRLIHIFQLESYKRPQLFLRLKEDNSPRRKLVRAWLICLAAQIVLLVVLGLFSYSTYDEFILLACYLPTAVFLTGMLVSYLQWKKLPSKKPLKVTARVVRLMASMFVVLELLQIVVAAILTALLVLAGTALQSAGLLGDSGGGTFYTALLSLFALFTPVFCILVSQMLIVFLLPRLLALASVIAGPVETAVKNWYLNDAKKKLAGFQDMIRIGITGSYGKTSAKVILATILSEKYKTYATPHSFNTPMGVTRAIREQLDGSYGVFIAEMGARYVGDIDEMCRLVQPKYGLITSIGPQHLETFLTLENVAKTKYELIEALPADGMAFFPDDGGTCLGLYNKTEKPKALFGFSGSAESLSLAAGEIESGPEGSTFTLTGMDGSSVRCQTRLLGRHNVQNITGCAAVATALGMTLGEIAGGIGKIEPVEHRLQIVPTTNGITVIDDAFNSNPAGTRAALEVLKSFPGRKIIVTPGLVELGGAEAEENEAFGRAMAGAVDIAILVARNAEAMKKGLLDAGFDADNLIVTGKLSEATAALGALIQVGDVVLFENDLPDHYEI